MEHFLAVMFLCCVEHVFYYRRQGKLMCLVKKKDQRVFSVVVAIFCGALMPRATILFSQTNTQSRRTASAFSVPVWHCKHQL